MATNDIQAHKNAEGIFHGGARKLALVSRAVVVGALLLAGSASAQAADSTDRVIPPNPAEVAMLRQLLALQHPALRQGSATQASAPSISPAAVTTEPGQQPNQAAGATEGEACTAPGATGCDQGAEAAGTRSAKLGESFRASLDHAMAAAGYDSARL